jgi:hypothetical protein
MELNKIAVMNCEKSLMLPRNRLGYQIQKEEQELNCSCKILPAIFS